MKFGKLGTIQDWTPQKTKGPSILGGWSSHGPLIFKTSGNSAGLLWYNHLQILALGDLDTGAMVPQKAQWSLLVTLDHESAEDLQTL